MLKIKLCPNCKKYKSIKEYHRDNSRYDGFYYYCKLCQYAQKKKWVDKNKEKVMKQSNEYYHRNKKHILRLRKINEINDPSIKIRRIESSKKYRKSLAGIFRHYKKSAKERNFSFDLTKDFISANISKPCFYCGEKPHRTSIDRVDNSKGYLISNVVISCLRCNIAKKNMTLADFLGMCKKIYERHG